MVVSSHGHLPLAIRNSMTRSNCARFLNGLGFAWIPDPALNFGLGLGESSGTDRAFAAFERCLAEMKEDLVPLVGLEPSTHSIYLDLLDFARMC